MMLTLQVSNLAGNNMIVQTGYITVLDVPMAEFIHATDMGTVTFTNTSVGGTSYSWDFGDGESSVNPSPVHEYDASGTYTVVLTVTNECGSATFTQEITVTLETSLQDWTATDVLDVFPNPNDGRFTLQLEGTDLAGERLQIGLINAIGQRLHAEQTLLTNNQWAKTFNFNHLAKGVYFLELNLKNQTLYKKLIIEQSDF